MYYFLPSLRQNKKISFDNKIDFISSDHTNENVIAYNELKKAYEKLGMRIPIYAILFGDASEEQLNKIANLTNGKIFDGKLDLVKAFKEVRGYN